MRNFNFITKKYIFNMHERRTYIMFYAHHIYRHLKYPLFSGLPN